MVAATLTDVTPLARIAAISEVNKKAASSISQALQSFFSLKDESLVGKQNATTVHQAKRQGDVQLDRMQIDRCQPNTIHRVQVRDDDDIFGRINSMTRATRSAIHYRRWL